MDAARNTIAENLVGGNKIVPDKNNFTIDQVPSQKDKVAIITGGSEGIGFACLHTLLNKDVSKAYVLSVDENIALETQKALASEMGEESALRMKWIQCDMADFSRVSEVAGQIDSEIDRLDILINNAGRGIMTQQITNYGIDRHMSVNHVGHVILTSHLLPLIKRTAEQGNTVRIVNQASNAHAAAPKECKFEGVDEINTNYGAQAQYGQAKLANILYSRYLARHVTGKYPKILINATHPGVVSTKMSTEDIHEPYPIAGYAMSKGLEPLKKDIFEGSLSALFAATTTERSGQYICPPAVPEPGSEQAQSESLSEQLMKLTREIIANKTKAKAQGCPIDDIVLY